MRGVIAVILLAALFTACTSGNDEAYIRQEIDNANYCDVDSDCIDAGSKCPFGCYAFVNANEAQRIRGLIESYSSDCVYSCMQCIPVCSNSTCVEQCG